MTMDYGAKGKEDGRKVPSNEKKGSGKGPYSGAENEKRSGCFIYTINQRKVGGASKNKST